MSDLNCVTLTGTLRRDPMTPYRAAAAQHVTFQLECLETNSAGATFTLFVPVECYGQAADAAGELRAGQSLLVAGKLKWTSWTAKDGTKRSSLCVLARMVKPLVPASVSYDTSAPATVTAPLGWPQRTHERTVG